LKADVIVNSTNENLDLNSGGVSRILLHAAGPELQKECTLKAPKDGLLQPGEIVATLAYNLDSEAVYHGIIVPWHFEPVLCELVRQQFISFYGSNYYFFKFIITPKVSSIYFLCEVRPGPLDHIYDLPLFLLKIRK